MTDLEEEKDRRSFNSFRHTKVVISDNREGS